MQFDVTFFGYGAGLVMAGWIAGQVIGFAGRLIKGSGVV